MKAADPKLKETVTAPKLKAHRGGRKAAFKPLPASLYAKVTDYERAADPAWEALSNEKPAPASPSTTASAPVQATNHLLNGAQLDSTPIPHTLTLASQAPEVSWEDLPAEKPARVPETSSAQAPVESSPLPAQTESITASNSLLTRALCEAIDAAKAGQAHAAAIGFPLTFTSSDIQDLASTIFIQRCRDGAVVERIAKPGHPVYERQMKGHSSSRIVPTFSAFPQN